MFLNVQSLIQKHVLLGEFQQHRIVEEFIDGNVLGQSLASPRLDHELACQMRRRLRFEGSNDDAFIQRISGDDLPVMKHGLTESLSLGVRAKIGFEAEGVDSGNES